MAWRIYVPVTLCIWNQRNSTVGLRPSCLLVGSVWFVMGSSVVSCSRHQQPVTNRSPIAHATYTVSSSSSSFYYAKKRSKNTHTHTHTPHTKHYNAKILKSILKVTHRPTSIRSTTWHNFCAKLAPNFTFDRPILHCTDWEYIMHTKAI